ncbi:hypothetical protein [Nocardia otitidiscaviarum]|nr:hypothetical protein [Nocardia otitidiscaviarum]MBF6183474.1 hypothetical protein [Nocardia otitidiscaviarum]MCP9623982.1 hypothetical protein [Nocardia otitidiscaviarum]
MKRLLFLILAILLAASMLDYTTAAGNYPLVVAAGIVAALLLVDRAIG